MTTKTITPATPRLPVPRPALLWTRPACTTEERLQRIESMGRRINGYVQFMCQGNAQGASADARDRAVGAFYEQMVVVDRQLGRIQEDFQLE